MNAAPDDANHAPTSADRRDSGSPPRPLPPGASAGGDAPDPLGAAASARAIIEEIKVRLADIAAREQTLQRRERDLAVRQQALQQQAVGAARAQVEEARRELEQARQRVDLRSRELDAQALELSTRQARLQQLERRISARAQELKRREQALSQSAEAWTAQRARHDDAQAQARRSLQRRIDVIRIREKELERRIRLARDEISAQRRELDELKAALDTQHQAIDAQQRELAGQQIARDSAAAALDARLADQRQAEAELARERETLRRREAEHRRAVEQAQRDQAESAQRRRREQTERLEREERQHKQVIAEREKEHRESVARRDQEHKDAVARRDLEHQQTLARRESELTESVRQREQALQKAVEQYEQERRRSTAELEQRAASLAEKSKATDELRRQFQQRSRQLEQRAADLDLRLRTLASDEHVLKELARELETREQDLTRRSAEVDLAQRRVTEIERSITESAAELERRLAAAAAADADARQRLDDAATLREQLEVRANELRQNTLTVELEQQELERERALLERQRGELAGLRDALQHELGEREQRIRLETLAAQNAALRRRWQPLTGAAAAGIAAAVCGAIWLYWDQPRFRIETELAVSSDRSDAGQAAREHAAALLTEGRARTDGLPDEAAVQGWRRALADGRVQVCPQPDRGLVSVRVESTDPGPDGRSVHAAIAAYIRSVAFESAASSSELAADVSAPLAAEWSQVSAELDQLQCTIDERTAALAAIPSESQRSELLAQIRRAQSEFTRSGDALGLARGELLDSAGGAPQRGAVLPADIDAALAADAVYHEDLKEHSAEVRAYQTELAVAMVTLVDPLKALRDALRSLGQTLEEQRALRPAPAVSVVLEEAAARIADYEEPLAAFSRSWDEQRRQVELIRIADDVAPLVTLYSSAAESLRQILDSVRNLRDDLRQRVDELSGAEGGGTRELVVTSLLRGELAALGDRLSALMDASRAMDLRSNFRLDAHDRQLRGLRTRMSQRRQLISEQLQAAADRESRRISEDRRLRLEDQVRTLEQQREQSLAELVQRLDELAAIDARLAERRRLQLALLQDEDQLERRRLRLDQLERQLAAARPAARPPDHVEAAPLRIVQVAGVNRYRDTTAVAGAAFAVTWLSFAAFSAVTQNRRAAAAALGARPVRETPAELAPR